MFHHRFQCTRQPIPEQPTKTCPFIGYLTPNPPQPARHPARPADRHRPDTARRTATPRRRIAEPYITPKSRKP
jgi:hypothetical protein